MTVRDIIMGSAGSSGTPFVDDVFSTAVYSGTGNIQGVTTTCDLSIGNSLIWTKNRSSNYSHILSDTVHGIDKYISTDSGANSGMTLWADRILSLGSTGYTIGQDTVGYFNGSGGLYVSWVFKEAPKFFDIVTYTGDGASSRQIPHSLGIPPGMVVIKRTDGGYGEWLVKHRYEEDSRLTSSALRLGGSGGALSTSSTACSATSFAVNIGEQAGLDNISGATYLAYVFAHDTSSDSIIKCGSFTTAADSTANINLGWEPQWLLIKSTSSSENWYLLDTVRGFIVSGNAGGQVSISPNNAGAENGLSLPNPSSRGFIAPIYGWLSASTSYIYVAIRRPNKPPTTGSQVFVPVTYSGNDTANTKITTGIMTDMVWSRARAFVSYTSVYDRLRGRVRRLETNTTNSAETTESGAGIGLWSFAETNGYRLGQDQSTGSINFGSRAFINWAFSRAPGFFDIVCYKGNGSTNTLYHNLGVRPELIMIRPRDYTLSWVVLNPGVSGSFTYFYPSFMGTTTGSNNGYGALTYLVNNPTAQSFTTGDTWETNNSAYNYVAYLFASCPGISKVGTYTGNGTSQTINCGFTTGARFIMIKRRDSAGEWYTWDSARGIVASFDPAVTISNTTTEVGLDDGIDPDNSGFIVNETSGTNINVTSATYLYLAIA